MSEQTEWVPGDPLFHHGSYTNYVFNFRDDPVDNDLCNCSDSASWPEARSHHNLSSHRDELTEFIEAWRMWRANQDGAA